METQDLSKDPKLAWVAGILSIAKKIMEENEGSLAPMFFVIDGRGKMGICPLDQLGDINVLDDKDQMAAFMRFACKKVRATKCVFLSDTWQTDAKDDPEAIAAMQAAGSYAAVPEEMKKRLRRREAIMATIETLDDGTHMLLQYYHRKDNGNTVVFEEFLLAPGEYQGRFVGLLDRSGS